MEKEKTSEGGDAEIDPGGGGRGGCGSLVQIGGFSSQGTAEYRCGGKSTDWSMEMHDDFRATADRDVAMSESAREAEEDDDAIGWTKVRPRQRRSNLKKGNPGGGSWRPIEQDYGRGRSIAGEEGYSRRGNPYKGTTEVRNRASNASRPRNQGRGRQPTAWLRRKMTGESSQGANSAKGAMPMGAKTSTTRTWTSAKSPPVSWSHICGGGKVIPEDCIVEKFEPVKEDGIAFACPQQEDIDEGSNFWKNSLVIYVLGDRPTYTQLKGYILRLWRPVGEIAIYSKKNGFFFVKFADINDCDRVLQNSPWLFDGRLVVMRKWVTGLELERDLLSKVPLWVRFDDLPLELWTRNSIGRVASLVGTPLHMDVATARRHRVGFARVFVEVSAKESLPENVNIRFPDGRIHSQHVEYEFRPPRCEGCCSFGHMAENCPYAPATTRTQPNHQEDVGNCARDTEEHNDRSQGRDNNRFTHPQSQCSKEKDSVDHSLDTLSVRAVGQSVHRYQGDVNGNGNQGAQLMDVQTNIDQYVHEKTMQGTEEGMANQNDELGNVTNSQALQLWNSETAKPDEITEIETEGEDSGNMNLRPSKLSGSHAEKERQEQEVHKEQPGSRSELVALNSVWLAQIAEATKQAGNKRNKGFRCASQKKLRK